MFKFIKILLSSFLGLFLILFIIGVGSPTNDSGNQKKLYNAVVNATSNPESQVQQNEHNQNIQPNNLTVANQIQIPSLLQNIHQEPADTSTPDTATPSDNPAFNKDFTKLIKNRYPSSDITKFEDLSSDEGRQAISEKSAQENIIQKKISEVLYSTYDLETDTEDKTLKIIVDGNEILENIDRLKQDGVVNSEVTQTFLNTYPILATGYVADCATSEIIHNLYLLFDQLDNLKVSVYLFWNDQYGTPQKHLIYTFNFNRKLFNKISWAGFHPKNLTAVVRNLNFSNWYKNSISGIET